MNQTTKVLRTPMGTRLSGWHVRRCLQTTFSEEVSHGTIKLSTKMLQILKFVGRAHLCRHRDYVIFDGTSYCLQKAKGQLW